MRFLKRQALDRRSANNTTLYSDAARANVYIAPVGAGSVIVPVGTNAQRPANPTNGMMRYSTDAVTNGQMEVYSAGRWRALRYAEQKQIIQQNLGAGDANNLYFGPLNSTYYNPSNNANNATIGGQNVLVIVENVIQVTTINYTVVQNPTTIPAESYAPKLSFNSTVGSTTLYFNTSLSVTGASGNGTTATLTFATQAQIPLAIGASIVVTGINSTGGVGNYNGTFTVTGSTTGSVSWSSATTATYQNGGEVDAVGAVYPAVTLLGAQVTGTNQAASTILSTVAITGTAGQFSCTSTTLAVNQAVVISGTFGGTGSITGYTNPTTYYITATNGTTTFTLSLTPGGAAITTTAGTPTGLTYTLPVSILSYVVDPNTDALVSAVISKATITSTIAVNTTVNIAVSAMSGSGYYLQFSTPVPYGKVVIALLGFDQ